MRITLIIFSFIFISCGGPPARVSFDSGSYMGLLYVNGCYQGESKIIYNDDDYYLGSKSSDEIYAFMDSVNKGQNVSAQPVSAEGCSKVFKMEFNGEFEKEPNPAGASNSDVQDVVQVYQYRML